MLSLGIVGYGFVGKATHLFSNANINCIVYDIDDKKCIPLGTTINDLLTTDIIFICLPTPMKHDGSCETSLIASALDKLKEHNNIIIRSTIPCDFCFDRPNIYYMPEFLTEFNWKSDFKENKYWIVGLPKEKSSNIILEKVIDLAYKEKCITYNNIIYHTNQEVEIIKLTRNCFLASKVSFSNEIYMLCKSKNIDYSNIYQTIGLDERINLSHLKVPNNNKFGYGGTCFPKDTNNLYSIFNSMNLKSYFLEASLLRNEFIDRPERDWLTDYNRTLLNCSLKIVLVTGGAGFIGSNLCIRLIKENNFVICIDDLSSGNLNNLREIMDHPNFTFKKHNIRNPLFIPKVNEIYHLACPASPPVYQKSPLKTIKTSIKGLWNILKICKHSKAKLLFSSTSEVYGDPLVHTQAEDYWGNVNMLGSRSCYDESKRLSETIIYEYRKKHNLDLKIVRIFNTFGPCMDLNDGRIITNIIKADFNRDTLVINGDGKQTRSFCFIDDLVNGLVLMMNSKEVGPINLGNPNLEVTINELVSVYEQFFQTKLNKEYILYDKDDPKQRKPDITKAIQTLGWTPKINLIDGLQKIYQYFKDLNP